MNTSGMARGYMAKNMKVDKFIEVVVSALGREFGFTVKVQVQDTVYTIEKHSPSKMFLVDYFYILTK